MHKNHLLLLSAFILNSMCFSLYADETTWHCVAEDADNKQWLGINTNQRESLNIAFDSCKKMSKLPATCKTTTSQCDLYVGSLSTNPLWECDAIDQLSMIWKSDVYRHADDAALAAKAFCKDRSALPDTCFINLLFCKNLNPL